METRRVCKKYERILNNILITYKNRQTCGFKMYNNILFVFLLNDKTAVTVGSSGYCSSLQIATYNIAMRISYADAKQTD